MTDNVPPPDFYFNEFSIHDHTLIRKWMHCDGCKQSNIVITILADLNKMRYVHCCESCQHGRKTRFFVKLKMSVFDTTKIPTQILTSPPITFSTQLSFHYKYNDFIFQPVSGEAISPSLIAPFQIISNSNQKFQLSSIYLVRPLASSSSSILKVDNCKSQLILTTDFLCILEHKLIDIQNSQQIVLYVVIAVKIDDIGTSSLNTAFNNVNNTTLNSRIFPLEQVAESAFVGGVHLVGITSCPAILLAFPTTGSLTLSSACTNLFGQLPPQLENLTISSFNVINHQWEKVSFILASGLTITASDTSPGILQYTFEADDSNNNKAVVQCEARTTAEEKYSRQAKYLVLIAILFVVFTVGIILYFYGQSSFSQILMRIFAI